MKLSDELRASLCKLDSLQNLTAEPVILERLKQYILSVKEKFYHWDNDIFIVSCIYKENTGEITLHRVVYEKSETLDYAKFSIFDERYVLLYTNDNCSIQSFYISPYTCIMNTAIQEVTLNAVKKNLPNFEYHLKGTIRGGCRYCYLLLNNFFSILSVSKNIKQYLHQNNYVRLDFGKSFLKHTKIVIKLSYKPQDQRKEGLFRITSDSLLLSSYCGFYPNNFSGSVVFQFIVPQYKRTVCNGMFIKTQKIKDGIQSEWKSNTEVTVCIIIEDLECMQNKEVALYSKTRNIEQKLNSYTSILEYFNDFHGKTGIKGALKIVEYPNLALDGMSFPNIILLDEQLNHYDPIERINIVAHEVVHQWWGNNIRFQGNLRDWLKESITEYLKNLYLKEQYGLFYFKYYMREAAALYFMATNKTQSDLPLSQTSPKFELLHDGLIYGKGVYILHMLTIIIGIETFKTIVQSFVDKYMGIKIDFWAFKRECDHYVQTNLDWFFNQWLFNPGYPKFTINSTISNNDQNPMLTLSINQNNTIIYQFPLTVEIDYYDSIKRDVVWVTQKKESIQLQLDKVPQAVTIDPDHDLLYHSKYFLSDVYILEAQNEIYDINTQIELYKRAIECDPGNAKAYFYLNDT